MRTTLALLATALLGTAALPFNHRFKAPEAHAAGLRRLGAIGPNGSEPGDGPLTPPGTTPPAWPQITDQFASDVTQQNSLFPFPLTGKYYFDYPAQVERLDASFFGQTQILLNVFATGDSYTITGAPGFYSCEWSNLTNDQMNTQIPPIARFLGTQPINGNTDTQVWDVTFFGLAYGRYWVSVNSDPKQVGVPVRMYNKLSAAGFTNENVLDFSNVVPGAQPASLFDPAQFGCAPPTPPPTFTVSGYVIDAVTGRTIAGAAVSVNGTTQNGRPFSTAVTANPQGTYTAVVPQGTYRIQIAAAGYLPTVTAPIEVAGNIGAGSGADLAVSPTLPAGAFRVVLKWGCCPRDLDAHMLTPSGVDVYYARKAAGGASLDIDRTNGFGPETVTVPDKSLGVWKYFVFNYSGGDMRPSGATVYLYTEQGLKQTLTIPTDQASQPWWHVFDVDATGAVTVVNKLVPTQQ